MPEKLTDSDVRARAFWSGTLTFGLVSIPVNLFPASSSQRIALRMVEAESGTPLARRYFCPKHEKELDSEEIVRGFETEDGDFVVVTDDELEALEPRKTRDIDLQRFVPAAQLDPIFFERGYYLTPAGESTKAYKLLTQVMEDSGRAGIATFVMRGKEYLIAIVPDNGILRAETLRFSDEIRSPADVGLPDKPRLSTADVEKIERAIERHTSAKLSEKELEDRYADRLLKLVTQKKRREEDVVEAPADEDEDDETSVIDLMEVLRKSLEGKAAAKKTARKSPAKKKRKAG